MSRYVALVAIALTVFAETADARRTLMSGERPSEHAPVRRLLGKSLTQSYFATIATTPTVWSTTIVTPRWYLADTNGFSNAQNQYVGSGFLTVAKDVPHGSGALSVTYQITATKVNAGYTWMTIVLTSNGKTVGELNGQTSLLPGTSIKGSAAVHFT
jgi:hypothetical protein